MRVHKMYPSNAQHWRHVRAFDKWQLSDFPRIVHVIKYAFFTSFFIITNWADIIYAMIR